MSKLKRIVIDFDHDDRGDLGFLVTPFYETFGREGQPLTVSCPAGGSWSTWGDALNDINAILAANGLDSPEGVVIRMTEVARDFCGIPRNDNPANHITDGAE